MAAFYGSKMTYNVFSGTLNPTHFTFYGSRCIYWQDDFAPSFNQLVDTTLHPEWLMVPTTPTLILQHMNTLVSMLACCKQRGRPLISTNNGRFGTNLDVRPRPLIPSSCSGKLWVATHLIKGCDETNGRRPEVRRWTTSDIFDGGVVDHTTLWTETGSRSRRQSVAGTKAKPLN